VPDPEDDDRRTDWQRWVTLIARVGLGVTLLVAGFLKVVDLEASADSVRAYQMLPYEVTSFVGAALPVIEIVLGILLIIGAFTRISAALTSGLMVIFIIAIATTWARGLSIDCGCFGSGGEVTPAETQYPLEIARDLGLLLLGAWTIWRPGAPWALDSWLFGSNSPTEDSDSTID
jgi:uncharacterized membrane protein YphA (DoxX/SURF4 family)